jgi:hypothetical protein
MLESKSEHTDRADPKVGAVLVDGDILKITLFRMSNEAGKIVKKIEMLTKRSIINYCSKTATTSWPIGRNLADFCIIFENQLLQFGRLAEIWQDCEKRQFKLPFLLPFL